MWEIDYSYVEDWLDAQTTQTVSSIFAALGVLAEKGPDLGRPLVDTVSNSMLANMKELRPSSPGDSEIRILFAFDPERRAILLLGGDKSKGKSGKFKWARWYRKAIPQAERRFIEHLKGLGERHVQS